MMEEQNISFEEQNTTDYDDSAELSERGDPTKFDKLCDGVIDALAIVHDNVREFMDFKDEMLLHSLPPIVLLKMGLCSGKVFRSLSDLHMPLNELIRLVRIYSTPWQEKSEALKKLHDSYQKKHRQLNVAIHRLVMHDENAKRIEKERRILNWEKLFCRVMTTKGQGRRWKFRMNNFRNVAKLGYEAVQAYVDSLDEENAGFAAIEDLKADDVDKDKVEEKDVIEPEVVEDQRPSSTPDLDGKIAHLIAADKPETRDRATWTHEPEYDRFVRARVFRPIGLNTEWVDMKCKLAYGAQIYKTKSLDPELSEEEKAAEHLGDKVQARGLIGMRGRGRGPAKTGGPKDTKKKGKEDLVHEDCEFRVADEIVGGLHHTTIKHDMLRVSIHHGAREQMVAIATIELEDLETIDLPTLFVDPPAGDDFVEPVPLIDSLMDAESSLAETERTKPHSGPDVNRSGPDVDRSGPQLSKASRSDEEKLKEVEPLHFPLYSIFGSKAETQTPCGQLPIIFYWVKRLRPMTFSRIAATESFRNVVLSVTGVDLDHHVTGQSPAPPVDRVDEACSVISLEDEPTVLKKDYDDLVMRHSLELEEMNNKYGLQMNIMAENQMALEEQLRQVRLVQPAPSTGLLSKGVRTAKSVNVSSVRSPSSACRDPNKPKSGVWISPGDLSSEIRPDPVVSRVSMVSQNGPSLAPVDAHPASRHAVTAPRHAVTASRPTVDPSSPYTQSASPLVTSDHHPPSVSIDDTRLARSGAVAAYRDRGNRSHSCVDGSPADFQERMRHYAENRARHLEDLEETRGKEVRAEIERRLECEYKLARHDDDVITALQDVNLPALFMPTRSTSGLYNPRAHQYFHPGGSGAIRISQPPSMVSLPPLPKHKVSVLNMFEMSNNFSRGPDFLLQRFLSPQEADYTSPIITTSVPSVNQTHTSTVLNSADNQ